MLASLVPVAPANFKLNNYVAQCYMAYGEPELAFEYINSNPQVFTERYFTSAWASLMSIAYDYSDEKGMDSILVQIFTNYEKDGLTPPEIASYLGFRSRVIGWLYTRGRYEEAVKRADTDLAWFDERARECENSPFFTQNNANPEMKLYYLGVYFPTTRITPLMYRQQSLAKLKRDLDKLYEPFEIMLKAAGGLKFSETSPYRAQPHYVRYRMYYTISGVARVAEDQKKADEYTKLGKESYDLYRAEIDKMNKEREQQNSQPKKAE
jgi:hypothetical protein